MAYSAGDTYQGPMPSGYGQAASRAARAPQGGGGHSAGSTYQGPQISDWYGGRNLESTESGWSTGFYRKAIEQRNQQYDRQRRTGNPDDFYNWFQRGDATGVSTWNDEKRMIDTGGGRRGLRAGDTFEDGKFLYNLYEKFDKKTADLMLGEFVFDGGQKARLFKADAEKPGTYGSELDRYIEQNSKQAKFGQQAYETRKDIERKSDEFSEGFADEATSFVAGAAGGAAIGSVFGIPGMVVGGIAGGIASFMNRDQMSTSIATAQVQAERAREQGLGASGAVSSFLTGAGALANHAVNPWQNLVSGTYDAIHGTQGDGTAQFHAVNSATGERIASGGWQAAHVGAMVVDSFFQFGSKAGLMAYQASLMPTIAGKVGTTVADQSVWSDAEGGWHKLDGAKEWAGAGAAIGIDVMQLGVSNMAVRAAAGAKAAGLGKDAAKAAREATVLPDASMIGDKVWSILPGMTKQSREAKAAYKEVAGRNKGLEGPGKVRAPETRAGSRFFFDETGNPIASRPTMVMGVPSEMTRALPAYMMARYRNIRTGGVPGAYTTEDLYEASLKMAGNGGRMSDAMLNAFSEGSEEMVQEFATTASYSGSQDAESIWRAGLYGFASGFGMGIGPMLSRASTEQQQKANARVLEMARTGNSDMTDEEWDARWSAMSAGERKRAATGSEADVAQVAKIGRTIAEMHRIEVGRNGLVPALVMREQAETMLEKTLSKTTKVSEGAVQARLLPNELYASDKDAEKAAEKAAETDRGIFQKPKFPPNSAGMTSWRMEREFKLKLKALREHHESLDDSDPEKAEAEVMVAAVEHLLGHVRSSRGALARADLTTDEGRQKWTAQVRWINATLREAAIEGRLRNAGPLDPALVRRAAKIAWARHPYIDKGSYFITIPQVYDAYEAENLHGAIGTFGTGAKVAQLDFDGDTQVELAQAIFSEGTLISMESGTQYLTPKEEVEEVVHKEADEAGAEVERVEKKLATGWTVNVDRPKDEPSILRYISQRRGWGANFGDSPHDPVVVGPMLNRLKNNLRNRYEAQLAATADMPHPFLAYWNRFEADFLIGKPSAVEDFVQAVVDHDGGNGGRNLLQLGRDQTHQPEILVMHQMFSTAFENISRTLKLHDESVVNVDEDTTPIAEVNRDAIQQIARREAATTSGTLAIFEGPAGERQAQHVKYFPFLQYALDMTLNRPDMHMEDLEIALARAFFEEAGAGRAESAAERAETRNATVDRVRGWAGRMSKALDSQVAEQTKTLDLLPSQGLLFLVTGMRTADVQEMEDGKAKIVPRNPRFKNGPRSDISLGQLLLRKSVEMDKNKHRATRADDPVHANLARLGKMAKREGKRSNSVHRTQREIHGNTNISEIFDPATAALFGPDATMNSIIQSLSVMSKVDRDTQIELWKSVHGPYVQGHRSDAPWSLEEIREQGLNAYTLFIDTIVSVINHESGDYAKASGAVSKEVKSVLLTVTESADQARRDAAPLIREWLGLAPGTGVTHEMAVEFVLYHEQFAKELVHLFSQDARIATFKILENGKVSSRRWVREAFLTKDEKKAELTILVESAIDVLIARGATLNRTETGELTDADGIDTSDDLDSRLAILINRLALLPSSVELTRFFELYRSSASQEEFFEAINNEPAWLGDGPPMFAYMDSLKDYESDPRDVWNSASPQAARYKELKGAASRMRAVSTAALEGERQRAADEITVNKLKRAQAARRNNVTPDPGDDWIYQRLQRQWRRAQRVADQPGARIQNTLLALSDELVDTSDKGAAPELIKALGDAYIISTSVNLQPGVMAEGEVATRYTEESVRANPQILLRGPTTIMTSRGEEVSMDLSSMDGLIEAYSDPAAVSLVNMAIMPTMHDIGTGEDAVSLQNYGLASPSATIEEHLAAVLDNQSVIGAGGGTITLEQAEHVLRTFDGFAMREAQHSGDPDQYAQGYLPVLGMVNDITLDYQTRPDYDRMDDKAKEKARNKAKIHVATLLIKMSGLPMSERMKALELMQAEFARRRAEVEGRILPVEEMVRIASGRAAPDHRIIISMVNQSMAHVLHIAEQQLMQEFSAWTDLQGRIEEAEASGDTDTWYRLSVSVAERGWTGEGFSTRFEELARRAAELMDDAQNMRVNTGWTGYDIAPMRYYTTAYNSYFVSYGDRSDAGVQARFRLMEYIKRNQTRFGVGKDVPGVVQYMLSAYSSAPNELLRGELEGDLFNDDNWALLAAVAARQTVADKAQLSGSSLQFGTTPNRKDDETHFWDESFSYQARPLANPLVLRAMDWVRSEFGTPDTSATEVAEWAMNSGPFRKDDFGKWDPLLPAAHVNIKKIRTGASVTLGVPIGGSLPKTQFDASIAGYSEWDADILPEHRTVGRLVVTRNTSLEDWKLFDEYDAENGKSPMKLHFHFAYKVDGSKLKDAIDKAVLDDEVFAKYLMKRFHHKTIEDALDNLAEMPEDSRARYRQEWAARLYLSIDRQFRQPAGDVPAKPGYYVMNLAQLKVKFDELFDLLGDSFDDIELGIEYVDVEKKPYTPEYVNHGMFDGLGTRGDIENNISPFAAMMFGVGGLSKILQQRVFDYAAKGGTAYQPYYPSNLERYKEMERRATSVAELMHLKAQHIMSQTYESGRLLYSDWNAVYKMVVGRHIYKGKDPAGNDRYMWAEEVIALENAAKREGKPWNTRQLQMIPISEEIFRLLHGASTKAAGTVVSYPEWNIDNINKNPELTPEFLDRLGLSNLGKRVGMARSSLAFLPPNQKWKPGGADITGTMRKSLAKSAEERARFASAADVWRTRHEKEGTIKKARARVTTLINNEIDPAGQAMIMAMAGVEVGIDQASAGRELAASLARRMKDNGKNAKLWYYQQNSAGDYSRGLLNQASLEGDDSPGMPAPQDVAVVDLSSIVRAFGGDTDRAFEEVLGVLRYFKNKGTPVGFVAVGNPVFSEQVRAFMSEGSLGYVRGQGGIWEPMTKDNWDGANLDAIRSTLTATTTFLAANAQVQINWIEEMATYVDENSGSALRPDQLNTPMAARRQFIPTTLTAAKINSRHRGLRFTIPKPGSPSYAEAIETASKLLGTPESIQQFTEMAARGQTRKQRDKDGNETEVLDPNPKDVSLYKEFDNGTEYPGIRSHEDALEKLQDTLAAGRLPLYDGQEDLRAGDYAVLYAGDGRVYFFRIGFESPSVAELEAAFANGEKMGVSRPKIDKATVVPPDFTIINRSDDEMGEDFFIHAPLSTWAKIVEQGDATKYTLVPFRSDYGLPDEVEGRNRKGIALGVSAVAQEGKYGYKRPGASLKTIFSIAGMDDVRLPLVNTLSGKKFDSVTADGFEEEWSSLLHVLNRWASADHGKNESQIKQMLNPGATLDDATTELFNRVPDYFKEHLQNGALSGIFTNGFAEMDRDSMITYYYMVTLMAPRLMPIHITKTPGIWTVEDPLTSKNGIIDMPDLWTDTLMNNPTTRRYFIEKANSRVAKFSDNSPFAGKPLGYWDDNLVYHQAITFKASDSSQAKLLYVRGTLSIEFPVGATQNEGTYTNIAVLNQRSGFTQHVAAVMALNAGVRQTQRKREEGRRTPLELMWESGAEEFDSDRDPLDVLYEVLRAGERISSTRTVDGEEVTTYKFADSRDWGAISPAEARRAARLRKTFRDYEYLIDRSKKKWKKDNPEIRKLTAEIEAMTGIDNYNGQLTAHIDKMVRMFYGFPGPIGLDQKDYKERVTPEDYLDALKHFKSQLAKNHDPLFGGAVPLMPASFAVALHQAGKWAPASKEGRGVTSLATTWNEWVQSLFGQFLESPMGVDPMFLEPLNGSIQVWKDNAGTLEGMGLSIDHIQNLLVKNRRVNETLQSIELLSNREFEDPLVLDAWDKVDAILNDTPAADDITRRDEAKAYRLNKAHTHRKQWLAKKGAPKPFKSKMTVKDYMANGNYFIKQNTNENKIYSALTNASHINRLFDLNILASGFIEQPMRVLTEVVTDLLTGRYTGRGAQALAAGREAGLVQGILGSDAMRAVTQSEGFKALGFGDFRQAFTREDQMVLGAGAEVLGQDSRWLDRLYENAQYMNLVHEGQGTVGKFLERSAGRVARVMSDPLYGTKQQSAAKRYLLGVVTHLHAMGERPNIPSLIRELTLDPYYLEKQYGKTGLTADKAGMNSVLQIRSQKATPFSRAIASTTNFLTSSPNRFFNFAGFAVNLPFAYARFTANGMQHITGMDGWSQAATMFFSGRKRPAFLGGGKDGKEDYWDLDDCLETMDLRRTFVRSGATLTMVFTLGMLAGGSFGFGGENEDERRRRRQAEYAGLVDVKDPREPENNFLNADAIFLDSIPGLSNLFSDGEGGASMFVPHWILRQFTSPILGMSRFFSTGDIREIGYGFFDAFSVIPNSVARIWDEADATAKMLMNEAEALSDDPSETGRAQMLSLLTTIVGTYERMLVENQFINGLYVGADKYDRDPWVMQKVNETGEQIVGPDGQPVETKNMEAFVDPETGEVITPYVSRRGSDGVLHQYSENNVVAASFLYLIHGMDSSFFRQNMAIKQREIELGSPDDAMGEAATIALYLQELDRRGGQLDALTEEEIGYAIKDQLSKQDVWWDQDEVNLMAKEFDAARTMEQGALSFMSPEGEVLTPYGGDRIIDGLLKGTLQMGSPAMANIAMDPEMRDRIAVSIRERLVEDGLRLGLPQKTAEYRAKRFWYGEDDRPEVPGIRDILYDKRIPYNSTVKYNQLNVMYAMGPDGKMWATPFERKTLSQVFLPTPHNVVGVGPGTSRDATGRIVDEVHSIHTGLAGVELVASPPQEKVDPPDDIFDVSDGGTSSDTTTYKNNYKPWKQFYRRGGGYGGGGGGGGGGFVRDMRAFPGGSAPRFDGMQFVNTSAPIIRRADVNRMRIWSERGRLKQWQ